MSETPPPAPPADRATCISIVAQAIDYFSTMDLDGVLPGLRLAEELLEAPDVAGFLDVGDYLYGRPPGHQSRHEALNAFVAEFKALEWLHDPATGQHVCGQCRQRREDGHAENCNRGLAMVALKRTEHA